MGGSHKRLSECTAKEIWAFELASSMIGSLMAIVTFPSHQPEWWLGFIHAFIFAMIAAAWYAGLRELRKMRRILACGKGPSVLSQYEAADRACYRLVT